MENNSGFGSSYVEDQLNNLRRVRGNRFAEDLTRAAQSGGNTWRIAEQFGVSKFLIGLLRDYRITQRPKRIVLRLAYLKLAAVLLLFVVVTASAQSTFDFWGLTSYKFGMSESQVLRVLKSQKRSYVLKQNSRQEDVVIVSGQIVDKYLLEGRIAQYFHFRGELFAKKRLETIRLVWLDWTEGGDNLDAIPILRERLFRLLLSEKPDSSGEYNVPLEFNGHPVDISPLPAVTVTINLSEE